jgi:hypothetical protein
MPSFHEFDVALSPGVPAAGASSRTPTNEAHINPWITGTKGTNVLILSDATHIGAGIGLTLTGAQVRAELNAPAQLVLGDLSGPWLVNIADLQVSSATLTLLAGVFIS